MENNENKPTTKRCTCCGRELPLEAFTINLHGIYGRQSRCKECLNKQYHEKKSEEIEDWRGKNMALDKFPWPFNSDEHEMDMDEIHNAAKELEE